VSVRSPYPSSTRLLLVTFSVYDCVGVPLPVAAERLRQVLPVPLARRRGARRGEYYRWSGDGGADLLVQANVVDEAGIPVEPLAAAYEALVYATDLPAGLQAALADVDGLRLLATDVVALPTA
jgi:hypothetical protein